MSTKLCSVRSLCITVHREIPESTLENKIHSYNQHSCMHILKFLYSLGINNKDNKYIIAKT